MQAARNYYGAEKGSRRAAKTRGGQSSGEPLLLPLHNTWSDLTLRWELGKQQDYAEEQDAAKRLMVDVALSLTPSSTCFPFGLLTYYVQIHS
jgi:hypothetical protein